MQFFFSILTALILVLVSLQRCEPATRSPGDSSQEKPVPSKKPAPIAHKVHKGEGWAIAAPRDWTPVSAPAPKALYLVGDDREGIPLFDGTLTPLKAGLLVEVFANSETSLKDRAENDAKELNGSRAFKVRQGPRIENVQLSDGSAALLFQAEFDRLQNGRLSFYQKVYCSDGHGRHVVATGFLTCGPASGPFVKGIGLLDFVRAHVTSLVLDPGKHDQKKLNRVYEEYDWQVGSGLQKTQVGNRLLEKENYTEAGKAFREALRICEHVSAAHNGLAWALVHAKEPQAEALEEALKHAKTAVQQTEELDTSALDTLALALYRNGDRAQAITTIQKALKLQPQNRELQRRMKSFEGKQ